MLNKKKFNKKGIYSITTTFMLVVIMVASILFLISFGVDSLYREKEVSDATSFLKEGIDLKEHIISCVKPLKTENLDVSVNDECLTEKLNGFKIEILDFFGCTKKQWVIGKNENCEKKISFYINIDENKTCLGRLVLCE